MKISTFVIASILGITATAQGAVSQGSGNETTDVDCGSFIGCNGCPTLNNECVCRHKYDPSTRPDIYYYCDKN